MAPMNDISPSSNCSSSADHDSNDDENNSTASPEFIDTEEIVAAGYEYSPLPDIQILPNNINNSNNNYNNAPDDYFFGSSANSNANTNISQENTDLNYTDIQDDLWEEQEDDCDRISSPTSTEDLSHLSQSNFDSATVTAANTERIQQAVRSIRLLAPHLAQKMDNGWEETQRTKCLVAQHPIIPLRPLAAFWESTTKAWNATQNLSRSATLAEIIVRAPTIHQRQDSNTFTIHLVGADGVECNNIHTIQVLFCPFVRWLDAFLQRTPPSSSLRNIEQVQILLIGPNIPMTATTTPIDLLPLVRTSDSHLKAASASCVTGLYHEYLSGESPPSHADLVVAFNAGIWGYKDWNPTIEILATQSRATTPVVTFVVTAYTLEESLDDADAIEQILSSLGNNEGQTKNLLWKPQINPFRSRIPRQTATAKEGRVYYENCAWQAWKFGGE